MSFCEFWFMYFVISFFWPPHLSSQHFWSSFVLCFSTWIRWANNITFIHSYFTLTQLYIYTLSDCEYQAGWQAGVSDVCLALAKMANHVSSNSFSLRHQKIFNAPTESCWCHFQLFITFVLERFFSPFHTMFITISHFPSLSFQREHSNVMSFRGAKSFKLKSFCDSKNFRESEWKKNQRTEWAH